MGESTFHLLGNKGAIGHIGGHFYDINGKEINTSLNDRMIGIGYNDLERCKNESVLLMEKRKQLLLQEL